ncbi:hypothetical protein O181_021485 [Austropuccinia psidii MF-1]|uniref:Uncharacterized protein n=1 Tax=Austropuccinia psidii MF-1 TaxID=1389203 RepID=A0A9Q3CFT4_9BASI|nr:hypothetical protein [Austropuccinia psidii MF-1]
MSPAQLRNLAFHRNQPEDREGLFRTRRPGRGHLGHSGEWKDNEGNHTHSAIHFPIQQEPQIRRLDRHGLSSSAPPTPQRFLSMEHGQQEISGQELSLFTIPGSFQEKTRIQGKKQDHFQPEKERVRPNDPEAVGFGEASTQEPQVVVNNSRISSPLNRNITPTQIENNAGSSESNLNSDSLWLQMSQYAEKTQKQFSEPEASHERMKQFAASMDKIVKPLQERHAQLRKAS